MPRHRKEAAPTELLDQPQVQPQAEPAPLMSDADWQEYEQIRNQVDTRECPWCHSQHPYNFDTNQCPERLERVRQMQTGEPQGAFEPAPFPPHLVATGQATNVMYHVAPESAEQSITENGLDYQQGEPLQTSVPIERGSDQWPLGNYLHSSLNDAQAYAQSRKQITGQPHHIWEVNTKGLQTKRDPQTDKYRPGYYTESPIEVPRLRRVGNIIDPVSKTLDPQVWMHPDAPDPQLNPKLNQWLHKVIYGALERNGYEGPQRWLKLVLTGSLCTYQFSPQSDCDVSLFVHGLPEWSRGEMIGIMVKEFDGILLPGTSHDIQAFVVSKTLTPQDLYKPGLRSAYDLETSKWIVPPDHKMAHDTGHEYPAEMTYAYECLDKLDRLLKYEPDKAVQYWNVLHRRRQREQTAGKGDFSQSNMAYKMILNRGYGERLRALGVKIF